MTARTFADRVVSQHLSLYLIDRRIAIDSTPQRDRFVADDRGVENDLFEALADISFARIVEEYHRGRVRRCSRWFVAGNRTCVRDVTCRSRKYQPIDSFWVLQ